MYLGVLPLIALVTLLHPRWPSRIAARDRLTWYVVGVFGFLLALGSNTPLEHLFNSRARSTAISACRAAT